MKARETEAMPPVTCTPMALKIDCRALTNRVRILFIPVGSLADLTGSALLVTPVVGRVYDGVLMEAISQDDLAILAGTWDLTTTGPQGTHVAERAVVKNQSAEVSHSPRRIENKRPPATGSTQGANLVDRTISTLATTAP